MNVSLISYTPYPELVVATAGKTCYSDKISTDILLENTDTFSEYGTTESAGKFVKRLMRMGHTSPLEHASFTFSVDGASRSLLAQITRHRIASFSVQSQRYVDMKSFKPVVPAAISDDINAKRKFDDLVIHSKMAYDDIHNYLMSSYLMERWSGEIKCDNPKYFHLSLEAAMNQKLKDKCIMESFYDQFKKDYSDAEKYANENARAVLPNATPTNFVFTMNARELIHFFSLRCCNRAQDEIRELADKILVLCKDVAPNIFADAGAPCVSGPCPEGKMSCGHPRNSEEG